MISRTLDPTFLNSVANHPEVRPEIGGDVEEVADLSPLVCDPNNITLEAEGGGWVLRRMGPGFYDLHTLFLPEARGKSYFQQAKRAMRMVFTEYDVVDISTWIPDPNAAAGMAAGLMGFRPWFRRDGAWLGGGGIDYRLFTVDDWFIRDAKVAQLAQHIHELLGGEGPIPDMGQGRVLAAAVLMIQGGQPQKGMAFYDRCAVAAQLIPAFLAPPRLLHVGNAILEIGPQEIRVLRGG